MMLSLPCRYPFGQEHLYVLSETYVQLPGRQGLLEHWLVAADESFLKPKLTARIEITAGIP